MESKSTALDSIELHNGTADWIAGRRPKIINAVPMDNADMRRMGKKQVFKRNYRVFSISSFSAVCMMGWVFLLPNAPILVSLAQPGGTIVIFLANFFGLYSTMFSLAEMASLAPTAGGQYHWTSEFAPPSMQKILSYVSGWLATLSWLSGLASGIYLAGNFAPVLISLSNPTMVPTTWQLAWQGYLFVLAISAVCFIVNGYLAKHLPLLEGIIFCFMIMGFVSIVIVLLVLSPEKLSSSEVFQSFPPSLDSTGALEILGAQVLMVYSMLGADSVTHMAEETEHAAMVIPQAMLWAFTGNGIMDFVVLITICFCFSNTNLIENAVPGYPFLGLFISATGSATGAIAITSVLIILMVLSSINYMASVSRQLFAFARDNGLPFSTWISKVDQRTLTPMNALTVTVLFTVLITLIGLGSTVAFEAIISLGLMAGACTYQVSFICLVWRRLYGRPLPPCPWSLGRWGIWFNLFSIVYGWYLLAYAAMPAIYPVTATNLNWAPVMFGAAVLLSSVYYFIWARKVFEGPVVKTIQISE